LKNPIETPVPILALKVREAAICSGVSETLIKRALRLSQLTGRKVGDALVIETHELRRWLASQPYRGRPPEGDDGSAQEAKPSRRGGAMRRRAGREKPTAPAAQLREVARCFAERGQE
jgi:hypothetical protein